MLRLLAVVVLAAGCYRPAAATSCAVQCGPGGACPSGLACFDGLCRSSSSDLCGSITVDASLADGPKRNIDAPGDGCTTFGTGLYTYTWCQAMPPLATMPSVFDTTSDCQGQPYYQLDTRGGSNVCVVIANRIDIASSGLTLSGTTPLVFVANDIEILGTISSSAGSDLHCPAPNVGLTGGGGPGGSSGTMGGNGGAGDGLTNAGARAATGLATLHGGCNGGNGGNAGLNNNDGSGGAGGGIIYAIGKSRIGITSSIGLFAPGRAGQGGYPNGAGGGGGGGSGGMIVLDTDGLVIGTNVTLCAQGGGGGGGGGTPGNQGVGSPGVDGCTLYPAGGGAGAMGGGTGGDGAFAGGTGVNGSDQGIFQNGAGGGGGGGGAGWIYGFGTGTVSALMAAAVTTTPPAQ